MSRPITLFTGQWTDLSFEELCKRANSWGYAGLEIACWGGHLDVHAAATDPAYVKERKALLEKYHLKCWTIGNHLAGQCVGDLWDARLDGFAPAELAGKPKEIRSWAIEEMKLTARAARQMGCDVVTGFMGSPIWKYWYSFPQTSDEMVDNAFREIVELWTPIFDEFDKQKVKFALEVHPSEIAFDIYTAERLLKEFKRRPTLGFNFDPSHLIWQGMDPKFLIRDFPDRIYHVHMKDAAVNFDGRTGVLGSHLAFGDLRRGWNFRSLGHGHVNFEEIIRELNAASYSGPLSVEWEDNGMEREFGAKEACDFVRKIDFAPSDVAFDKKMGNA
ncbi:MAG TPA: sugar phosphate isomerase/epimerase [Spirochaetia bacterium]|nr:sugar phosphate isomerase/epimerase [Spirochaetia bacterium]